MGCRAELLTRIITQTLACASMSMFLHSHLLLFHLLAWTIRSRPLP